VSPPRTPREARPIAYRGWTRTISKAIGSGHINSSLIIGGREKGPINETVIYVEYAAYHTEVPFFSSHLATNSTYKVYSRTQNAPLPRHRDCVRFYEYRRTCPLGLFAKTYTRAVLILRTQLQHRHHTQSTSEPFLRNLPGYLEMIYCSDERVED